MKDPAFLFYSKDFYEGTRMMLPEERGCYVDLMIYQHQHGIIPNDTKRLMMYCSGCSEEVIQSVLNQKFNQVVDGWSNKRLNQTVEERAEFKPKKIAAGTLAGLISKSQLNDNQRKSLKKKFNISDFIYENDELVSDETLIKLNVRKWFNQMVKPLVNNINIANANEDINKKGGMGENLTAYNFLQKNEQHEIEVFEMHNKSSFEDYDVFIENFNSKVIEEEIEFIPKKLLARLRRLNTNWNKKKKPQIVKDNPDPNWKPKSKMRFV